MLKLTLQDEEIIDRALLMYSSIMKSRFKHEKEALRATDVDFKIYNHIKELKENENE